ncbi:MAG: hypothetical protein MZU91_15275 [Desulfosudis oleivorans]|nr:hypothetical protein [Desulfosudis oleivorans]
MNRQPWRFSDRGEPANRSSRLSDDEQEELCPDLQGRPVLPAQALRGHPPQPRFNVFYDAPCVVYVCGALSGLGSLQVDCALAACPTSCLPPLQGARAPAGSPWGRRVRDPGHPEGTGDHSGPADRGARDPGVPEDGPGAARTQRARHPALPVVNAVEPVCGQIICLTGRFLFHYRSREFGVGIRSRVIQGQLKTDRRETLERMVHLKRSLLLLAALLAIHVSPAR